MPLRILIAIVLLFISIGIAYALLHKDIFHAIENDDGTRITAWLKQTPALLTERKNGLPPLHYAVRKGKQNALDALIKGGANPNEDDRNGNTALLIAVKWGNANAFDTLIAEGADVNEPDYRNRTPLALAIATGQENVAMTLLSQERIAVNKDSEHGNTPLHIAVREARYPIIDALLAHDTLDPSRANEEGDTALHFAIRAYAEGEDEMKRVIQELVAFGDDVLAVRNVTRDTSLHLFIAEAHILTDTPLLYTFISNASARTLNILDGDDNTPLARLLTRVRDDYRGTFIDPSYITYRELETIAGVARALIRAGANPYRMNIDGRSACHIAADTIIVVSTNEHANEGATKGRTHTEGDMTAIHFNNVLTFLMEGEQKYDRRWLMADIDGKTVADHVKESVREARSAIREADIEGKGAFSGFLSSVKGAYGEVFVADYEERAMREVALRTYIEQRKTIVSNIIFYTNQYNETKNYGKKYQLAGTLMQLEQMREQFDAQIKAIARDLSIDVALPAIAGTNTAPSAGNKRTTNENNGEEGAIEGSGLEYVPLP